MQINIYYIGCIFRLQYHPSEQFWHQKQSSTNMNSANAATEYSARTKFLRLLSISARHFNLNWHIQGAFIRHLIAGDTGDKVKGTPLTIFLTPGIPGIPGISSNRGDIYNVLKNKTQSMVGELEVMGVLKGGGCGQGGEEMEPMVAQGPLCVEPVHIIYSFTASMHNYTATSLSHVNFPVVFKAFPSASMIADSRLYPFDSDNILLSAHGLYCMEPTARGNKATPTFGSIDLVDKMVNMQHLKNIPQATGYTTTPWLVGAAKNAALLLRTKELVAEGYTVEGGEAHVTIETECEGGCCPICYEAEGHFASFECGHMFCVDCITKHMVSGNLYSPPACPMCRAHIVPQHGVNVA